MDTRTANKHQNSPIPISPNVVKSASYTAVADTHKSFLMPAKSHNAGKHLLPISSLTSLQCSHLLLFSGHCRVKRHHCSCFCQKRNMETAVAGE
ncbi:hypothetical protein CDAR_239991 [Caerostris darwini]|uniref:Uncharacterized protein n=1 Tax=Caerostris darwini TaxID=1538125 RepID=A0AAV4T089_9ARAC|nr:hypothetical protein CDAR_239991 [Caerostris darwini]